MKSATRIYLVRNTDSDTGEVLLVRATSQAAALKHATAPWIASLATQEQIVGALEKGVQVETPKAAVSE